MAAICVVDLGRTELVDRLGQRFDAEVSLKRVLYPPGQHLPGIPVHGGDEIKEATAHGKVVSLIDHLRSLILSRVSATCKVLFEVIPFGASSRHPRRRRPEGDIRDA